MSLLFPCFFLLGTGEMLGCERKSCRPPFSISHVPLLTLLTDFTCITVSTCQCQKKERVEKMKIRDETGREDTHFAHASANTSTNTQCIPDPVIVVFFLARPSKEWDSEDQAGKRYMYLHVCRSTNKRKQSSRPRTGTQAEAHLFFI